MIKKLNKLIALFVFLAFFSANSYAVDKKEISLNFKANSIEFTMPDTIKNTTFKRFNDIWIVFSDKNIKLNYNKQKMQTYGVKSIENLIVKNGAGFRFRFNNEKMPDISFEQNYTQRTNSIVLNFKNITVNNTDSIKFRVANFQENENIKQLFLDSTYILDYAYSLQTGEKYLIAISADKRLKYYTKLVNNGLYFLPTLSGAVIISENGEYLNILEENLIGLSNQEDKFFLKANKNFRVDSIDEFFYDNNINLIEKQTRDYSAFNRQVNNYKSNGDYNSALKNLNNALNIINNFNYNVKPNVNINNGGIIKKLDSINIQESGVIDMSAEDDGFFINESANIKSSLEKDINLEDEEAVLVPDYASQNTSFLLEKLRLSSIKQTSNYNKERITIKRMQINAYRNYFAETIDLSKMLRQDISGTFPKNNKGLALYALASANLGRCDDVINLPEKDGSIYTQDLKLWKAYCLQKINKNQPALALFKQYTDRIETYPQSLKNKLKLSYAITLKNTDNYNHSTALLTELEKTNDDRFKEEVKFYLGLNYLYQNEAGLAQSEFKDLLFSQNFEVKYKARLEYLNVLLQSKDADKKTIIKALEDLRFDFRGNDTELEATKVLASIYLQEDYIKKAMDLYKYISIYFSDSSSAQQAAEILFNIFANLFDKNQVLNSNINDVERLSLFYDFIELTPSEYEGNKIITNVVNDLTDLGLYDNAIKLLNIQLNFKTKDPKVAEMLGEKLADLYVKTGQLNNAVDVLKATQRFEGSINYTDNAKLVVAKVLIIKNENIKKAIELLKSVKNGVKSKYILADLYWKNNNYEKIIDELEELFLPEKIELDEDGIINLSYLMMSFALEKNIDKLKQIKSLYKDELVKVDLDNKLNFLLKMAGEDIAVDTKDSNLVNVWEQVIAVDDKLKGFESDYNKKVNYRKSLLN